MRGMSDFTVVIEQDEDGIYVAKVPDIQGCATQAKTIPELLERIKEAITVCIEAEATLATFILTEEKQLFLCTEMRISV